MVEKSLNLKSAEAYSLAHRVARITGESMTQAVTVALRERLARLDKRPRNASLADDLMAIGADCAARLSSRTKRLDHGALLYDEKGLPR
ncbi:MAG: type II toxin-antitoxin system VapB family antitoxin [Bryobacteraceae bacterium]|nr:type II toxin-antitoxin system VapB family antitoxin [Bryobacteraceae bacterium]